MRSSCCKRYISGAPSFAVAVGAARLDPAVVIGVVIAVVAVETAKIAARENGPLVLGSI